MSFTSAGTQQLAKNQHHTPTLPTSSSCVKTHSWGFMIHAGLEGISTRHCLAWPGSLARPPHPFPVRKQTDHQALTLDQPWDLVQVHQANTHPSVCQDCLQTLSRAAKPESRGPESPRRSMANSGQTPPLQQRPLLPNLLPPSHGAGSRPSTHRKPPGSPSTDCAADVHGPLVPTEPPATQVSGRQMSPPAQCILHPTHPWLPPEEQAGPPAAARGGPWQGRVTGQPQACSTYALPPPHLTPSSAEPSFLM